MAHGQAPVTGVCPVVETPFTPDGEVDYDSFNTLLEYLASCRIRTVMFPGFASEFYKLTDTERAMLTDQLLRFTAGQSDISAIISVPDHSTKVAVDVATHAAGGGASAINILPPYQLGPSRDGVHHHLLAILDAVAPTPVVVQYAPAQTGTALDSSQIAHLARQAPNLREVKVESTPPGTLITALLNEKPSLPSVVGYGGVQLIDALRRGAAGVQPGGSFVELYVDIWESWQSGNVDQAIEMHTRMLPYISYWMQSVELIIAAEKRISMLRGIIRSEHCRAPARSLDGEETAMIDRFLDEFDSQLTRLPKWSSRT